MSTFTVTRAARSIKSAIMLILHDFNHETEFSELSNLPTDNNGRLMFTYEGVQMPCVHGPNGTALWPGISVEFGSVEQIIPTKFIFPITISFTREIANSVEQESELLDTLTTPIDSFLYVDQTCPIYTFTTHSDDATAIEGQVNWWQNSPLELRPIEPKIISPLELDNWLVKEYSFEAYYTRIV